jgi:hypothetical protein
MTNVTKSFFTCASPGPGLVNLSHISWGGRKSKRRGEGGHLLFPRITEALLLLLIHRHLIGEDEHAVPTGRAVD